MDLMKPTPELAAAVVAWHNRHPLAKRLSAAQVMGIGVVALPFWSPDALPLTDRADAVFPAPPAFNGVSLAPEATAATESGSPKPAKMGAASSRLGLAGMALIHRLMAPWAGRVKQLVSRRRPTAGGADPGRAALRSSFSEDFIAPLTPRQVADFALRQGSSSRPGAPEWPQRDVLPDAGTPASVPVVRFVHSAAIEVGKARGRVLIGVGPRPKVLGQRLMSRSRLLGAASGVAAMLLMSLVAVLTFSHPGTSAHGDPQLAAAAAASAASAGASAAEAAQAPAHAASGQLVALGPEAASAPHEAEAPSHPDISASAIAPTASSPLTTAAHTSVATAAVPPASGAAESEAPPTRSIRPELSAEAREAARQQSNELRQAKAAQAASSPDAPKATEAHASKGQAYAVATIPTRTRAGSQLRLVLMGAPEIARAGEPHAEVMQVAEGWRAVMWPYPSREAAETVRDMFASRGIKAEVIEF